MEEETNQPRPQPKELPVVNTHVVTEIVGQPIEPVADTETK